MSSDISVGAIAYCWMNSSNSDKVKLMFSNSVIPASTKVLPTLLLAVEVPPIDLAVCVYRDRRVEWPKVELLIALRGLLVPLEITLIAGVDRRVVGVTARAPVLDSRKPRDEEAALMLVGDSITVDPRVELLGTLSLEALANALCITFFTTRCRRPSRVRDRRSTLFNILEDCVDATVTVRTHTHTYTHNDRNRRWLNQIERARDATVRSILESNCLSAKRLS